jgi:hypothetical protein
MEGRIVYKDDHTIVINTPNARFLRVDEPIILHRQQADELVVRPASTKEQAESNEAFCNPTTLKEGLYLINANLPLRIRHSESVFNSLIEMNRLNRENLMFAKQASVDPIVPVYGESVIRFTLASITPNEPLYLVIDCLEKMLREQLDGTILRQGQKLFIKANSALRHDACLTVVEIQGGFNSPQFVSHPVRDDTEFLLLSTPTELN